MRYSTILTLFTILVALASPAFTQGGVISDDLRSKMTGLQNGSTLPVMVFLKNQADLDNFTSGREGADRLIRHLQEIAEQSQKPVLRFLEDSGYDSEIKTFWINNSLALEAAPDLVRQLAAQDQVQIIEFDAPVKLMDSELIQNNNQSRDTYWNLNIVGVPDVWNVYGLDGTGIILGSMDTGMDITHPALVGKWRGGTNSWLDLVNGQTTPYDDHGHGTHTIGTMVGGDGPGPFTNDIGVAYNAKVISAKVLDQNNSFSSASIVIAGAQWMLDPDGNPNTDDFPHVINNSWYFFSSTYTGFYTAASAWRAAGIIPVFCQGNEGPNASTTRPPGSYNNVIGVGATTSSDAIASFSSRGPAPIGTAFPTDGRKPDLSAPGQSVTSCLPGGVYAAWSGTSMAAPNVAATIGLMLQYNPSLDYEQISDILTTTALDLGTAGYDYAFGYGRMDSYAALTRLANVTAVEEPLVTQTLFRLGAAVPNPATISTDISFEISESRPVHLSIYGVDGRLVSRLIPGTTMQGRHRVRWNGRDDNGVLAPSGVYFYKLESGAYAETKSMVLVK